MPTDKDLKRLVRARMQKTGEAYTAARAQVLKKPARARISSRSAADTAPPTTIPTPQPDYAALAGMADAKVIARTGRGWEEWVRILDSHDAARLPHRDIARLLSERYDTPDWWTQTVAVGYERIKRIREIGQRRDGSYEASKSRTFDVPVTTLYDAWARASIRRQWLDDTGLTVRTSSRPKYMRLDFGDGTIVIVGFTAKGRAKSSVAVQHTKVSDRTAVDGLKRFWTERLTALGEVL